jgi:molybdopterin synthase sulfur carrier subunit
MNFRFSGALLRFVDYERTVQVEADALGPALHRLEERHPQLRAVLRDGEGNVRRTHRIFLNGEQVGSADPELPLKETDEVEVLTAIAGG